MIPSYDELLEGCTAAFIRLNALTEADRFGYTTHGKVPVHLDYIRENLKTILGVLLAGSKSC